VILEPDALPQIISGCITGQDAERRYQLLHDAVRTLKADRHSFVYIDAGNSGWITDPNAEIGPLKRAGINDGDGFAINVSNFQTTAASISYGDIISQGLGGTHYVIDTGRNGNGPLPAGVTALRWCNPPGRALGQNPTTTTGRLGVDAYLWIKQPGSSDGSCRPGEPPAGQWWTDYALNLARGRLNPSG
jgi:endoglucanase